MTGYPAHVHLGLRETIRPGGVAASLRRLLPQLPRPRRAAAIMGLTCGEVLSQVGIAVIGQRMLAGALAQPPRSIWGLALVALVLVGIFSWLSGNATWSKSALRWNGAAAAWTG